MSCIFGVIASGDAIKDEFLEMKEALNTPPKPKFISLSDPSFRMGAFKLYPDLSITSKISSGHIKVWADIRIYNRADLKRQLSLNLPLIFDT